MKKRGFTLAEVLITMGIIGVVAALTAPQLVMSSRNEATCSKLATTVSNLENAFQNAMVQEEVTGLNGTTFFAQTANSNAMIGQLGRYIHLSGIQPVRVNDANVNAMYTKSGVAFRIIKNTADEDAAQPRNENTMRTNGGSLIHKIATIDIYTNPTTERNSRPGRDEFEFYLGNDGAMYPRGGLDAEVNRINGAATTANGLYNTTSVAGATNTCNSTTQSVACTARIIDDGYKMNY